MSFARLYVHVVWTTLDRSPQLTPDREEWLRDCLFTIAERNKLVLGRVGVARDHVHVVALLPRDRSVADLAQQLKGASAHEWNLRFTDDHRLQWQRGYWAETVSPHAVPALLDHVERQRELHAPSTPSTPPMIEAWETLAEAALTSP
jgi:putative transposase